MRKVRNGAERIENKKRKWTPLNINITEHYEEKSEIAIKAAELCLPGERLINCGSTAFMLGQRCAVKTCKL